MLTHATLGAHLATLAILLPIHASVLSGWAPWEQDRAAPIRSEKQAKSGQSAIKVAWRSGRSYYFSQIGRTHITGHLTVTLHNVGSEPLRSVILDVRIDRTKHPERPSAQLYQVHSIDDVAKTLKAAGGQPFATLPDKYRIEDLRGEYVPLRPTIRLDDLGRWSDTVFATDLPVKQCRLTDTARFNVQVGCDLIPEGTNVRLLLFADEVKDQPPSLGAKATLTIGKRQCTIDIESGGGELDEC